MGTGCPSDSLGFEAWRSAVSAGSLFRCFTGIQHHQRRLHRLQSPSGTAVPAKVSSAPLPALQRTALSSSSCSPGVTLGATERGLSPKPYFGGPQDPTLSCCGEPSSLAPSPAPTCTCDETRDLSFPHPTEPGPEGPPGPGPQPQRVRRPRHLLSSLLGWEPCHVPCVPASARSVGPVGSDRAC